MRPFIQTCCSRRQEWREDHKGQYLGGSQPLNSLATYQDHNFIHLYWRQTSLYRLYALQNESKQEIGSFFFYLFGVIIINFWYKILRYWPIFLRTCKELPIFFLNYNFSRLSLNFYNWPIFFMNFYFIRKQTKTP